jgi:outer membrane protein TolC
LIIAQTNVQLQEVKLKAMMTKVIGPEIAAIPLEPLDTLEGTMGVQVPPVDEALKSVMRKPPVRQAQISLENHQLAEAFTRNNLRPSFNLIGQVSTNSLAPGIGGVFGQTVRYNYPEFAIGFSLNFTVKNRAAQADNVRARLERQQAEVVLDQAKANMTLSIRTSITNLTPSRSQVEAAQRATASGQETADAEQERWNIGVSTIDRVYQTRVDLVRAQLAEIQSRLNYAKSLMAAESAAGTFLDVNNLSMDGGIKGSLWNGPSPR